MKDRTRDICILNWLVMLLIEIDLLLPCHAFSVELEPIKSVITVSKSSENSPVEIYCNDGPPFQSLSEDGSLTGSSAEIVLEMQKRVGGNEKIQVVPWARGYTYLQNRPNVLLFSTTKTKEREPMFHWIGPVANVSFAFYSKAD